jgi:methyltransferase (TIGR00027 family)
MVPNAPSQTAEAVCLMRATEQRKPPAERILDDPYAKLFLGRLARAALASWDASGVVGDFAARLSPGVATYVLTRHRFIDDCVRCALAGGVQQLVLLGAGYDSRAYRFAPELKKRPVFEVDFPATSQRKARILARRADSLPPVDVRRIEIDFETDSLQDRLREAGFRTGVRSFVVWEGVSMYLTRSAVKATLTTLRAITAPRSELAMDFWYLLDAPDLITSAYRMSANLLSLLGEPVTFGIHPEDVVPFLARLGYRVVDLADEASLEHRYVRDGRRVLPGSYLVHAQMKDDPGVRARHDSAAAPKPEKKARKGRTPRRAGARPDS